jgi:hypothetical protein
VGPQLLAHVKRCEVCFHWMVSRYANRRRCGPTCHAKVWTRAYRQDKRRAATVPAIVPASSRSGVKTSPRQSSGQRKTLR